MLKLISKEAVRYAHSEGWYTPKDIGEAFDHILRHYVNLPRKKRGGFRMELEKVNGVTQFEM